MAQIGTLKIYQAGSPVVVPVFATTDVTANNIRVKVGGTWGVLNMVNDGSGDLPIKAKINGTWYQAKSTIAAPLTDLKGHLLDDFADGKYNIARDTFATTPFDAGEPASSAYTTNTRPLWFNMSGSQSIASGGLNLIVTGTVKSMVRAPSTMLVGTWEYQFQYSAIPTSGHSTVSLATTVNDASGDPALCDEGYVVYISSSGAMRFATSTAGTLGYIITADSIWTPDAALHTLKITRDGAGLWEIFLDGISGGTVTDTTYTNLQYVMLGNSKANNNIFWDNIKHY